MAFIWFKCRKYRSRLRSKDQAERISAARALAQLGDTRVVGDLYNMIKGGNLPNVSSAFAEALANIGMQSPEAVMVLINDKNQLSNTRAGAALALRDVCGDRAESSLIQALRDPNRDVCEAAIDSISYTRTKTRLEALLSRVQDTSWSGRLPLGSWMNPGFGPPPEHIQRYIRDIMDTEVLVRLAAVKALTKLDDDRGFQLLLTALQEQGGQGGEDTNKIMTMRVLELIGDLRAVEPLRAVLGGGADAVIKQVAVEVLSKLHHTGPDNN